MIASTPNVNFTVGGSRAHYIQIRGIGERSQFESPVNPSVGLNIDGIDFSQSALGVTLFDLQQIEVLKGPQGTTFGINGMAGVVNMRSNEPTKETTGRVELTAGNYNKKSVGVAVGGTLLEDVLVGRFSVYKNLSDGYMQNSFLNREDTQNIDELTAKAHLRWFASDNHTIDLNLMHIDVDNGYDAFTLDNSRDSHSDNPGKDTQKTDAFSLISTYKVKDILHIITKIHHSQSDLGYSYDEDWSYVGEFVEDLGPYSSTDSYERNRRQSDIDIRVISDEKGQIAHLMDWTIGLYHKNQTEDLIRDYTYNENLFSNSFDTQSSAFYGQLDTHVTDNVTLVTGLRVEQWSAEYSDSNSIKIDTDETLIGGKVGLNYVLTSDKLLYINLSKGFKPGGVNANDSLLASDKAYNTESLWNVDLGLNSSYLNNRIKSRVNLFYGKRDDQQIKSSVELIKDDNSREFISYLGNAGEGSYYGLESQFDWYVTDTLLLFSNIGLLQSEFDSYKNSNPDALDLEGRMPAQSPTHQYNIGFSYTFLDSFVLKSNLEGRGSYYFSDSHNQKSDAYRLFNSSLSYMFNSVEVNVWVNNIMDETYQTRGFFFGNNPANGYASELFTQQGDPRTFGATLFYDF